MKEVTYFVADDGKQFEDEEDCIEYEMEQNLRRHANDLILLDMDKKPLRAEDVRDCYYVVVRSKKGIEVAKEIFDAYGFFNPWDSYSNNEEKCGVYIYNSDYDNWYNVEEIINKYMNELTEVAFILGNDFGFESICK